MQDMTEERISGSPPNRRQWTIDENLTESGFYTGTDCALWRDISVLMREWKAFIDSNYPKDMADLFYTDGFYPHYTAQRRKVLFVAREACYMSGKHYIPTVLYEILRSNPGNRWTIDQYPFHRRQFYITFGLLNGFPEWDKVPWGSASEIATPSGISWAFMNLSKFSNETDDWRTDPRRYNSFVGNAVNREMIRREIQLLAPDIIVGSNVYELISIMGYNENDMKRDAKGNCYLYGLDSDLPPYANCYHFSAVKNERECYYDSVAEVVKTYLPGWR